jgi:hypothetical protein
MENVLVTLTITCCFLAGFGGFLVLFGFLRWLRYQETMQLAEKGLVHPGYGSNGKGTLRWGLAITALGIALSIGLYPIGFLPGISGEFPLNFGPWMLVGLLPMFFGLSLIVIYTLTPKNESDETNTAGKIDVLDADEEDGV